MRISDWSSDVCSSDLYPVIGVQFGGKPNDYRYYDKRSEMLFELCDWIKKGGALAPDPGLKEELCALRYVYQGDKFSVVPTAIIKPQIGRSADKSDAPGLTFAEPVDHGVRRQATPAAVGSTFE